MSFRAIFVTSTHGGSRIGTSTTELVHSGRTRGHEVLVVDPADLACESGGLLRGLCRPVGDVTVSPEHNVVLGEPNEELICSGDVLWLRVQPPIDTAYLALCNLLDLGSKGPLCINAPRGILMWPEKVALMPFVGLQPPTIITASPETLRQFRHEHKDVVLKPLFDYQGHGVFHITPQDRNADAAVWLMLQKYQTPLVMQKYIPEVTNGDKRIFLLDGHPIGSFKRIPAAEKDIANLHAGGTAAEAALSARDLEICRLLGPHLRAAGLYFVGIDVIGNYITEIGTTSPTGLAEVRKLTGEPLADRVWTWVERHAANRSG